MTTTFVGRRVAPWLPVTRKHLRPPIWLQLVWLLLVKLPVWLVLLVARSPVALVVFAFVVLTLAAYRLGGPLLAVSPYVLILGAFLGVRIRYPELYERRVALLTRSRW